MNRAGTTLVELAVALVIAATVILAAHYGLTTVRDVSARADHHRTRALTEAAVRRQLADWLFAASSLGLGDTPFQGLDRKLPTGFPGDILAFVTLHPDPFSSRATYLILGIDDEGLTAELQPLSANRDSLGRIVFVRTAESRQRMVVVPGASGFDVRFLFDAEPERLWFPGWHSSVRLPLAVEMRILGTELPALLREPITVALGSQ